MIKQVQFKEAAVNYSVEGSGDTMVFLHGYLESLEIWTPFIRRFTDNYRVISVDLPGHGKSGVWGENHSMEELAEAVKLVMEEENVSRTVMFGHSLGGYVTMAFADRYPDLLKGYALFHSTCFADNEEKKKNRDREISLVRCGKKLQIVNSSIPKGFADSNLERMNEEVNRVKKMAAKTPDEGIIAILNGMKQRADRSNVLKLPVPPPLIIWGEKDNYIPEEVFKKLVNTAPHASVVILKNSGHMGFLEEPDCVYSGILNYLSELE